MPTQRNPISYLVSDTILSMFAGMALTALAGCSDGSSGGAASLAEGFDPLVAKMSVCRAKLSATTLADGRILIAGGHETNPVSRSHASAEIFDPTTRTFTTTGSMLDRRQCHTATLLPDGSVLVAGGNNETDQAYSTAEIYDPVTGEFSATDDMAEERTCAMATLLPNGTVLIAGGYDTFGVFSSTAEIYDPETGLFGDPIPMNFEHSCHAQVLMRNGLVLLTTGCISGFDRLEVFDWRDSSFTYVGDLSCQRKYPFFELLPDGRVLIAGGQAEGDDVPTAETYTPSYSGAPGTITLLSSTLGTGRWRGAHALLPDGRVLLMGGATERPGGGSSYLRTAEIFDPVSGEFSGELRMSVARGNWPRCVVTQAGYAVVFGGIDGYGEASDSSDIWAIMQDVAGSR
ncbi:MAG: kelch repeat-containing protein [Planctomycetota bacterium]